MKAQKIMNNPIVRYVCYVISKTQASTLKIAQNKTNLLKHTTDSIVQCKGVVQSNNLTTSNGCHVPMCFKLYAPEWHQPKEATHV